VLKIDAHAHFSKLWRKLRHLAFFTSQCVSSVCSCDIFRFMARRRRELSHGIKFSVLIHRWGPWVTRHRENPDVRIRFPLSLSRRRAQHRIFLKSRAKHVAVVAYPTTMVAANCYILLTTTSWYTAIYYKLLISPNHCSCYQLFLLQL